MKKYIFILKRNMGFLEKIKKERWDLHMMWGAILILPIILVLGLLNTLEYLRWFDISMISFVFGCIIGLIFEIYQEEKSGTEPKTFLHKFLVKIKAIPLNGKTKVDKYDVLFTGVGSAICGLIIGLIFFI